MLFLPLRPSQPDIVEKLFGFFFGEKEKEPLGLKRVTRDSAPETWKATKTEFAEPLSSDRGEAALIRPLLARTNIEKRALKVTYDARKDGWTPRAFHRGVDFKGPSVVVAKTKGGAIVGGYNPKGESLRCRRGRAGRPPSRTARQHAAVAAR